MLKPDDLLNFIELSGFEHDWKRLGLDDADLTALQLVIMAGGKQAPIVPGTGGLRKLRFAPAAWNTGKRGAVRVCFAYFEKVGIVLLIVAYGKNEKDNLTASEKQVIRQLIADAERELKRRTNDSPKDETR